MRFFLPGLLAKAFLLILTVFLKELKNCNRKLFLYPPQKIGNNINQYFKLLLFKVNIHIKRSIYKQKTNFTTYKQYLFGPLFTRNVRETDTDQSIL